MMKILKKTPPILFVLPFFLILVQVSYSPSFTIPCERTNLNIQIVPSQIDSGLKNVLLNLSVNSPSKNATTLNISLPSVFSFVENSNDTSENTTFTFYSSENILSWKNNTVLGFLNSSGWFSFNVSTSEILNSTSHTITVNINNIDDTCYCDETSVSLIASIWSKSDKFYVTPRGIVDFFPLQNLYLSGSSIFLGNITFYLKSLSTLNLSIKNTSYVFKPLYAQDELYSSDCFQNSNLFLVKINDTYSNETQIKGSANLTIISKDTCPPGLYSVNFTIFETTNKSESLVLPFKLNIPISDKNLIEDDKAIVKGKIASGRHEFVLLLPSSNYSFISWYFYSTNSSDKILFYDFSNNVRGYGVSGSRGYINVGNSKKFLIKIFSTDPQLHKISFDISLIPLNVTENGVPLDKINFTALKKDEDLTKEISLENCGNKAYEFDVSARLFKKLIFSSSASTTFNFFVHPSVVEIYARLEWNDKGNYSMKLINPDELVVNSSYMASENDYNWMELYFDDPESGLWKVDVDKFEGGSYNLTVLLVLNESEFIHLHNSSFILNGFESGNVSITLKIPESSPSGLIEGEVKFDMNASHFILPLEVYANTTEFVVNNGYENIEAYTEDNIGFNRTGENNITLILNISNIGTLPFSISLVNFSSRLNNTLNSSWFVRVSNVSIQRTQVDTGNYSLVNVTLYVLTNETLNKEGRYVGDLWLNFSSEEGNELVKSILVLNLSSLLKLRIISIDPNIVSTSENLIIEVVPKYLNDSFIKYLQSNNFTVELKETNTSKIYSFEYPLLSAKDAGNLYELNLSIPQGTLGGKFKIIAKVNHFINPHLQGSNSSSEYVWINNTGLKFFLIKNYTDALKPNEKTYVYVKIVNYGLLASDPSTDKISLNKSCDSISISKYLHTCSENTTYNSSKNEYGVLLNGTSECFVSWKIYALDSGSCELKIKVSGRWYSPLSKTFDITVSNVTEAPAIPRALEEEEEEKVHKISVIADSLIIVYQNSTNSSIVNVKNLGDYEEEIKVEIYGINSSWVSINPQTFYLSPGSEKLVNLSFKVGFPEIKEYEGKIVVFYGNLSVNKTFVLQVWPSKLLIEAIDVSVKEIEEKIEELSSILDELSKKGINIFSTIVKLNLTLQKFEKLKEYFEKGNYFKAYSLFNEVKAMVKELEGEISEYGKEEVGFDIWFYVKIISAAVGLLVLAYLFWPEELEYTYQKRFYKKRIWKRSVEAAIKRIKKIISKMKF